MSGKMNADEKALHSLSSCLRTKLNCLSGIKWDSGQPGRVKAQQVCEMKGCKLTKCAAVSASPSGFCFLLQTPAEPLWKSTGAFLWTNGSAWKATKTNPLRTCMTAGTCGLVTQALQRASMTTQYLFNTGENKETRWLTLGLMTHSKPVRLYLLRFLKEASPQAWRKPSLKETRRECSPKCQFALLWNKAVYCTPMCHQTVRAFPAAREEIPAFFLTLILRCSVEAKTRCAYLHCTTQVLLWMDPDYTKQDL